MIKDITELNNKLLYTIEYSYKDILTIFKYTLIDDLKRSISLTTI